MEALRPQRPPQDAWVAQLLRDRGAPLATAGPSPDYAAQVAALQSAITATEQEAQRVRAALSEEAATELRPAKAARAREIADALTRALHLIGEDYAACREVLEVGYDAPPTILGFGDRDVLEAVVQRLRASALLDD